MLAKDEAASLRIVGNLPYNISTPILFHLARFAPLVKDMVFMLQKEVVMRMVALPADKLGAKDEALLEAIVSAAFGQRRKTLKNTLRAYLDEADFSALGIDSGLRGEKLDVSQFVAIANHCSAKKA